MIFINNCIYDSLNPNFITRSRATNTVTDDTQKLNSELLEKKKLIAELKIQLNTYYEQWNNVNIDTKIKQKINNYLHNLVNNQKRIGTTKIVEKLNKLKQKIPPLSNQDRFINLSDYN